MKKRLLWSAFAMTVLVLLGFFAPLIYWRITGLVRGEAFYAGMPSCYWREAAKEAIKRNKDVSPTPPMPDPSSWRESFQEWKKIWFPPESVTLMKMIDDPDAIPVWRDLFHDQDDEIRAGAAGVICSLGEHDPEMIPEMVQYIMSEAPRDLRGQFAAHMHHFDSKQAVPLLCKWLDRDDEAASHASTALARYCGRAEDAIPLLAKNMEKENDRGASQALPWIGPKSIPALKQLLKSDNIHARRNATEALVLWNEGDFPENFPDLVELLVKQSRDRDVPVRMLALGSLLRVTERRASALASLGKMLRDPAPLVRKSAIATLSGGLDHVGPEFNAACAQLRSVAVFDEDEDVRMAAKNALTSYLNRPWY